MHKRAFNIEKRIERMDKTEKPLKERTMHTRFAEYELASKDLICVKGLCKSYGEIRVLDTLDFLVQRGERVAIIGANGCGKSTLLKTIVGEETADGGLVKIGESVKLAYLPQIVTFPDPTLSIL